MYYTAISVIGISLHAKGTKLYLRTIGRIAQYINKIIYYLSISDIGYALINNTVRMYLISYRIWYGIPYTIYI